MIKDINRFVPYSKEILSLFSNLEGMKLMRLHLFSTLTLIILLFFISTGCQKETLPKLPIVTTGTVSDITTTTSTCGGTVTSNGGTPVAKRGVCWSTNNLPKYPNSKTKDGSGDGNFTSSLTGLKPGTTYYVRAYAINTGGTAYGSVVSFTTKGSAEWTNYTTVNGLIHNYVNAICIDSQGNKWFATNGGASKFDGTSWTSYGTPAYPLSSNFILSMGIDPQGNKWFGTNSGITLFDGTNWTIIKSTATGLQNDNIAAIYIDSQGNKWFGTNGGGVSKYDGISWTTYTASNNGLASSYISSIANRPGRL